jgi:hypothetical protein
VFKKCGETLNSTLEELGRTLIALWVIVVSSDGLGTDFRSFANALVHVVHRRYCEERQISALAGPKIRTAIGKWQQVLTFPI